MRLFGFSPSAHFSHEIFMEMASNFRQRRFHFVRKEISISFVVAAEEEANRFATA
ncbi:hypothetical protein B4168_0185 [Anoxybacillus flavithermus]|nr:hypothetical protein B4168_0185 [Anoxybacillus flavithermus]OAO88897.1 hypothetical protein GT23_0137 [Parageobacillus thermoglucosidasius]